MGAESAQPVSAFTMGNTVSRIMASMEIGPHTSVEEAEKAAENQIPVSHLIKVGHAVAKEAACGHIVCLTCGLSQVALGSAVGFWLLAKGSTYLARDTAFFNRLSAVKQRRFPTYMTSLVHAAVGAAWAWYKVGWYVDRSLAPARPLSSWQTHNCWLWDQQRRGGCTWQPPHHCVRVGVLRERPVGDPS